MHTCVYIHTYVYIYTNGKQDESRRLRVSEVGLMNQTRMGKEDWMVSGRVAHRRHTPSLVVKVKTVSVATTVGETVS